MSFSRKKIAFIGSGNMARCLIKGLVNNQFDPKNILVTGRNKQQLLDLQRALGVKASTSNKEALSFADIIVLCLKPFQLQAVCHELASSGERLAALFVSVAAGIPMEAYSRWLEDGVAMVRAMPNTPSAIGLGVCALFANVNVSELQKNEASELMSSVGDVFWLQSDTQFHAVTALSGSGPAYVFLWMEALRAAGIKAGLDPEQVGPITQRMVAGAAQLALEYHGDIADLRVQVTSPGGTTEHALKAFESGGLAELVDSALQAAMKRSREIAEDMEEVE